MRKLISVLILMIFMACGLHSQDVVTVQGRNIQVNSRNYIIRGVCYSSVAKGNDRYNPMDLSHIDQDIQLLVQANINTIRTYCPIINKDALDKFATAGIKIIMGIPSFDDTYQYPDILNGTYLTYINTYKNHKAILMWELGNEYNYHPEWFSNNIANWYSMLNSAAGAIHTADPNHPVSTAHGEVPDLTALNSCPNVDVWGMNVYRWDNPTGAITEYASKMNKPCYLSEAGGDRFNNSAGVENQQNQANADLTIWNHVKDNLNKCSGVTFFEFLDEWWKSGNKTTHDAAGFSMSIPYDNYANEEWWGIVDVDRNTTLAYNALRNAFTEFTSGINDLPAEDTFRIYPTIATDKLTVSLSQTINETVTLSISTLSGSQIVSEQLPVQGKNIEFSLSRYAITGGMYILSLKGKSFIMNHRFIKQ